MAESLRRMASVCFRSVMSFEIATTATGTVCRPLIRLTVAWTGNSRPVLWRTHSSPAQSPPRATLCAISRSVAPPARPSAPPMMPRSVIFSPSALSGPKPYNRSDARFQYVMRQSPSMPITDWPISSSSSDCMTRSSRCSPAIDPSDRCSPNGSAL